MWVKHQVPGGIVYLLRSSEQFQNVERARLLPLFTGGKRALRHGEFGVFAPSDTLEVGLRYSARLLVRVALYDAQEVITRTANILTRCQECIDGITCRIQRLEEKRLSGISDLEKWRQENERIIRETKLFAEKYSSTGYAREVYCQRGAQAHREIQHDAPLTEDERSSIRPTLVALVSSLPSDISAPFKPKEVYEQIISTF